MADPVTIMIVGSTILGAFGQIQAGKAADAQGKAQQQQAEFEAQQRESVAGQERANAQRKSIEAQRDKRLVMSRARAVSASSGAGADDAGLVGILGDLEQEGEYNAGVALYEGEERARSLETGASISRYEGTQARLAGKQAKKSSFLSAGTTILSGMASAGKNSKSTSMFEKYGGNK